VTLYLLYEYKSTNTDAQGAAADQERVRQENLLREKERRLLYPQDIPFSAERTIRGGAGDRPTSKKM
jgi:hypothetical protein